MITSRTVLDTAGQTGFRPEIVEKVLRLNGILGRLREHPSSRNLWVLKGGTALNLFHMDVPRLSVDIDLNFVGASDLCRATHLTRRACSTSTRTCSHVRGFGWLSSVPLQHLARTAARFSRPNQG